MRLAGSVRESRATERAHRCEEFDVEHFGCRQMRAKEGTGRQEVTPMVRVLEERR